MTREDTRRALRRSAAWVRALLAWFEAHRRPMPWRDAPTPYAVWISEIMLQQTQVGAVMPRFDQFMARFPDVQALAAADEQEVLKAWEGMGYYARARNLHRAARQVTAQHGGRLPETAAGLRALPGIGLYTAAAVASIAHGEPVPAVDGNVLRVMARFRGLADDIARPATRARIAAWLAPHIRTADPSQFNQAMMELGALVCRPRTPRCAACPLARACVARRAGRTAELPVKARASAGPHVQEVAAIVERAGRVLVVRRPAAGMLGGLWEFPGGRVTAGADAAEVVARRVTALTGVEVRATHALAVVDHAYSHFRTTVRAYGCRRTGGRLRPSSDDGGAARWVARAALDALPLTGVARRLAGSAWPRPG